MTAIEVQLPGAGVLFTTRQGGVSEGPFESLNLGNLVDSIESVVENRRRAAERAGLDSEQIAMGTQVHGADVLEWSSPAGGWYANPGTAEARVDGHLTAEPDLGLLVLVADCFPLALAGPDRVAMLHCGWRGLAAGIVERALERFDEPPAAAIGPGIGPCCYEVGDEVLAAFADLDGVAQGRMLDLSAVIARKLERAGVTHVEDVDLCTSCNPELFFSHRRDQGVTGRQGGLAWRT